MKLSRKIIPFVLIVSMLNGCGKVETHTEKQPPSVESGLTDQETITNNTETEQTSEKIMQFNNYNEIAEYASGMSKNMSDILSKHDVEHVIAPNGYTLLNKVPYVDRYLDGTKFANAYKYDIYADYINGQGTEVISYAGRFPESSLSAETKELIVFAEMITKASGVEITAAQLYDHINNTNSKQINIGEGRPIVIASNKKLWINAVHRDEVEFFVLEYNHCFDVQSSEQKPVNYASPDEYNKSMVDDFERYDFVNIGAKYGLVETNRFTRNDRERTEVLVLTEPNTGIEVVIDILRAPHLNDGEFADKISISVEVNDLPIWQYYGLDMYESSDDLSVLRQEILDTNIIQMCNEFLNALNSPLQGTEEQILNELLTTDFITAYNGGEYEATSETRGDASHIIIPHNNMTNLYGSGQESQDRCLRASFVTKLRVNDAVEPDCAYINFDINLLVPVLINGKGSV